MGQIEIITQFIEYKGITKAQFERNCKLSNGYLANIEKSNSRISQKMIEKIISVYPELESKLENRKDTAEELRRNKAFTVTEDKGLIYVPIAAQAGYALHYTDTLYLNDLERLYIPGNPFKGDRYRFFEVEGDSMLPTLTEGMQVIGQKLEPETWKSLQDYYIHIIVTESQILIKRLVKLDADTLVMVSDNEELYPQVSILYAEVKELWLVKRTLDWRMAPPKRIELNIKK